MHIHLRVFFYQQEQLESAVCEENAVCTELMALPRDNYFSLKSCSCPNGYTCPDRPGTSTLPFGRGRWWETKLILISCSFFRRYQLIKSFIISLDDGGKQSLYLLLGRFFRWFKLIKLFIIFVCHILQNYRRYLGNCANFWSR